MRLPLLLVLLSLSVSVYGLSYRSGQDPKSYVSHLRIQYHTGYSLIEAEGKLAHALSIYQTPRWDWGMMAAVTLYIHPADVLLGYYPVDNLIGYIGFYGSLQNLFGLSNLTLSIYPLAHESSHLVDGYDRGDINTDQVRDSNEYMGFDLSWSLTPQLVLYGGFLFYLYFPPSAFQFSVRPLLFRLHAGQEWSMVLTPRLGFYLGSDLALFYEEGFHPALNLAAGLEFSSSRLLLHYEYQRGLGQDFREQQQRIGLELQLR